MKGHLLYENNYLQGRVEGALLERLESIIGDDHTYVAPGFTRGSLLKKAKTLKSFSATAVRIFFRICPTSNGFNLPVLVWIGTCIPRFVRVMLS